MASLLTERLFEISGQGPSPNKNFYHLAITQSEVIWSWWKISMRNKGRNSSPGKLRESHQCYLDNSRLHSQVCMVFGRRVLQYTQALCQGRYDYLERLPDPLLLRILTYLELEDVGQLGRTSHRFRQLCGSEEFWEQAVRKRCDTVSAEVASLALEVGWRSIFFTSKLQLQKQISRWRLRTEQQQDTEPCDPDTKAESPGGSPGTDAEIHRAEEAEAHPGIVTDPSVGTSGDADPVPDAELEVGSDSSLNRVPVPDLLCEDVQRCVVVTPVQDGTSGALGVGRGDCSADP